MEMTPSVQQQSGDNSVEINKANHKITLRQLSVMCGHLILKMNVSHSEKNEKVEVNFLR